MASQLSLTRTCEPLVGGGRKASAPTIDRDVDEIAPRVRATIRQAVNGELPWPLVFVGPAGAGKSCAALCVFDRFGGWYLTVAELLEKILLSQRGDLRTASGHSWTATELWRDWSTASVAILDELGSRSTVSDFHYEQVKRAIDLRQERPLIVVSNHTIERIADLYDDRIASRLAGGTVIAFEGKDRRLSCRKSHVEAVA